MATLESKGRKGIDVCLRWHRQYRDLVRAMDMGWEGKSKTSLFSKVSKREARASSVVD